MEAIAFVGPYLFATKPAIRALLKAAYLCAKEPEAGARVLEHRGFEPRYDVIVKVLEEVIYWNWRDAHPEDALHFLGLRLHEAGMISTTHASCWVPCDHVPVRSWPLFRARQLMRDVIESFKQDQAL